VPSQERSQPPLYTMYDPFMDSFNESPALPPPLAPSRSATPQSAAKPSNDVAIATQAASGTAGPSSIDPELATTFDPLASLSAKPRLSRPQTPRHTPALPKIPASDPSTSTPSLPSTHSATDAGKTSHETLADLFGATPTDSNQQLPPVRPAARRKFSTTPLFQPLIPTHTHISGTSGPSISPSTKTQTGRTLTHQREISDDFGSFVSIPVQSDPLSSASSLVSTSASKSDEQPGDTKFNLNTFNAFTEEAQKRHSQNASRIMGELAKDPSAGGDFLGWLEKLEVNQVEEIFEEKLASKERAAKSNIDEGPYSPPATPTEGPPPTTRKPKPSNVGTVVQGSQEPSIAPQISGQHGQDTHDGYADRIAPVGPGSYFSSSLPKSFTNFLSNATPTVAGVSPPLHTGQPKQGVENIDNTHAIFALPRNTSLSSLASLPHIASSATAQQSKNVLPQVAPTSLSRAIPDSFLTHNTPFSTNQYMPPSGAPGYKGDREWDTGGFAKEWDDEVEGQPATNPKANVPRVVKLIGRREMTVGVLTRGLGDSVSDYTLASSFHPI
jgi:hypothetical protein